jgi:hypothetical protein
MMHGADVTTFPPYGRSLIKLIIIVFFAGKESSSSSLMGCLFIGNNLNIQQDADNHHHSPDFTMYTLEVACKQF